MFELLKIIAALSIIAGAIYYWLTSGPPPRGKGRWRSILKQIRERRR